MCPLSATVGIAPHLVAMLRTIFDRAFLSPEIPVKYPLHWS